MEQTTERMCAKCGATLPPDARFCPKCGSTVATDFSPPGAALKPVATNRRWVVVTALAVAILVTIIWAVVASKPQAPIQRSAAPSFGTVAEGTSTAATSSIGDTKDMQSQAAEIQETEARAILARYLDAQDPYHEPANCLDIRGTGYSNRGFAFDVFDTCQSQRLGSWRVDSVTRELFEQKADGRYLHP